MTTLADKSLLSGGDNKPAMLDKHLYDSWKSKMELYMMNIPHGRMILASIEKGPLVWLTITVDGVTRPKEYTELTPRRNHSTDYDIKAIITFYKAIQTEFMLLIVNIALKNNLRKLKGKTLVDNDVTKHPSDPEMLKIDVEAITPKLLNKQTAHSAYIKHTQEEATILRDLVEHVKSKYPLDQSLESTCRFLNQYLPNKKEPSKSIGSKVSDVPSSSFDECRLSKLFSGSRGNNLYTLSLGDMMASSPICLLSKASKTKSWLWHRRLSHSNFGAINHLARQGLVRGLSKLKLENDHLCSACAMGKSKKKTYKPKSKDTNQEKLYLLHMDLCGPMRVASVNGKKYILVNFNDYSQFTR
ncbi:retrovirus-related pol polyprotein from transposon TNT 1-94 [Tanacetum coccineum]